MNRTKIEWCDYTWSPVTGCWGPGGTAEAPKRCWYCYANKLSFRFKSGLEDPFRPSFYPYRLSQPAKVKKPARIFVCSMGDLFGDWVPWEWIAEIMDIVKKNLHHTFIFLTKNPKRYSAEFLSPWPLNCWLGATITNQADADERTLELLQAQAPVRFVSVEPMLGPVDFTNCWGLPFEREGNSVLMGHPLLRRIQWIIVGAMTGPGSKKHRPEPSWVDSLVEQARAAGVPLFLKNNLLFSPPYFIKYAGVEEFPA